jgi:hypothetical protein
MSARFTVTCLAWRPIRKNTLAGFAKIRLEELHLLIHDVALHRKGDATWAQLPGRPWIKDGTVVRDEAGKTQFSPILEFELGATRDAFSRAVVAAVRVFAPDALEVEVGA